MGSYITAQSRDVFPYTCLERKQPFEKCAIFFTCDQVCGQIRTPLLYCHRKISWNLANSSGLMGRRSLRVRLRSWALWLRRTVVIWMPSAPKMCSRPRSPRTTYLPSGCMNTLAGLALCASWNAASVGLPSVCLRRACVLLRRRVSRCVGRSCPGSSHTLCVPRPALSFPFQPCPCQQPGKESVLSGLLWKHRHFARPLQDYSDETPKVHPWLATPGEPNTSPSPVIARSPGIWQILRGLWADARCVCACAHGRCGYAVRS